MIPRFFHPEILRPGQAISLRGEELHHLRKVRRLKVGEEIALFDGKGVGFTGRIVDLTAREARVVLEAQEPAFRESSLRIVLIAAISKGEKLEWVVQKATELGVSEVRPVYARHADILPVAGREARKVERWRRVALEACKQSGRTRIPVIHEPRELEAVLARRDEEVGVVLDPGGSGEGWERLLEKLPRAAALTLAVGPEGGWSAREREAFLAAGHEAVPLGPRVLRTETAAIVAVALFQFLAGDLGPVGRGRGLPGR
jgi:16S rRNA (uracil1498-N3)-methyltransferase